MGSPDTALFWELCSIMGLGIGGIVPNLVVYRDILTKPRFEEMESEEIEECFRRDVRDKGKVGFLFFYLTKFGRYEAYDDRRQDY